MASALIPSLRQSLSLPSSVVILTVKVKTKGFKKVTFASLSSWRHAYVHSRKRAHIRGRPSHTRCWLLPLPESCVRNPSAPPETAAVLRRSEGLASWASPSRGAQLRQHQRLQRGTAARRQGGRQETWLGIAEAGAERLGAQRHTML